MKKLLLFIFSISFSICAFAQSPFMISYQAVATNSTGAELVSTDISVRASFLKGSTTGLVVYSEIHDVRTDQFGLFTIDLGSKPTLASDLSRVDWSRWPFYLKIELAVPKGSTFKEIGISQLLSVPYAIYSSKSDTAKVTLSAINDKDGDPTNELQALKYDSLTQRIKIVPAGTPGTGSDIVIRDGDGDSKNELQALKYDSLTQKIQILPAGTAGSAGEIVIKDGDKDSKNELQTLNFDATSGKLKIVTGTTPTSSEEVVIKDGDGDSRNEIQTMKFDPLTGTLGLYDPNGLKGSEVNTREGLFTQPGSSPIFPQGILGTYRIVKQGTTYTVPINKTFYVTSNGNSSVPSTDISIERFGIKLQLRSGPNGPIFPGGTKILDSKLTGFEIDATAKIEAVVIDLKTPYQIPPNKTLFIKSGIGIGDNTLMVDDDLTGYYATTTNGTQMITIPGGPNGLTIKNPIGVPTVLTGYLLDLQ